MPSPLAHGLAGLSIHVASSRDALELRNPTRAAWIVGAALVPDLDLLLRLVDGRNHHNNETHSIGFSIGLALLAAVIMRLAARASPWRLGAWVGAACLSHVLLDYLNRDTNPPLGIMALWPLDSSHYNFAWPLFLDIGRRLDAETLRSNAVAGAWELAILLPILVLVWRNGPIHRS
jgi:membrane-bound metal-dependent hydrolase YbcI (DUF457 family)